MNQERKAGRVSTGNVKHGEKKYRQRKIEENKWGNVLMMVGDR